MAYLCIFFFAKLHFVILESMLTGVIQQGHVLSHSYMKRVYRQIVTVWHTNIMCISQIYKYHRSKLAMKSSSSFCHICEFKDS